MKLRLVEHLACPLCGTPFVLDASSGGADDIETGTLVCSGEGHPFEIRDGIPRLVPRDLPAAQKRTARAFGWQWTHFVEMHPEYEDQFLDWIFPIQPDFFRDKLVLDAGCGIGRHAYFAAAYGAREVVAVDLSDAVETAHEILRKFPNSHVVQADLLNLPFRRSDGHGEFDLVYSIGVLHHLSDPRAGFNSISGVLAPGGTVAIWVYGHEGNGFVRNVVEPMRSVTTRLPPSVLAAVAFPLGLAFHGVAKGIYGPLRGTSAGRILPMNSYLGSVADFSLRQNYTIVYDQLVAPTSAYIEGDEVRRWLDEESLEDAALSHRHGNSWRGHGRRPVHATTTRS
jgi:SAM-dependent methyltransferase